MDSLGRALQQIIQQELPVFAAYLFFPVLIEGLISKFILKKKFPLTEGKTTVIIGVTELVSTGVVLYYLQPFFENLQMYSLYHFSKGPGSWVFALLAAEFIFYVSHRASHSVRWFWNEHRVHHSSTEMNLFVGNRNGWTFSLAGLWIFSIPLVLLGFEWNELKWGLFLILNYQFFVHTETIKTLGPLEYILNTPSLHRVHHATQKPYLDKNFGGITLIFDYLFNSLQREIPGLKPVYGLDGEAPATGILRTVFDGWLQMFREFSRAGSIRQKLQVLTSMKKPQQTLTEKEEHKLCG